MRRGRKLRSAACALGLALASGQEPAPAAAASPADQGRAEIDRLVEKLEALDAFLAEYRIVTPDGTSSFVIEYEAPANARLRMLEGGKDVREVIIEDGVFAMRAGAGAAQDEGPSWQLDAHSIFARWSDAALDAVRARAPALAAELGAKADAMAYGPMFEVELSPRSAQDEAGRRMNVGLTYASSACSHFHWLCALRRNAEQLEIGAEQLSLPVDDGVIQVSKETGFVVACTWGGGDGRRELKLERLLLDEAVPDGGISIPGDIPGAPDGIQDSVHAAAIGGACRFVTETLGTAAEERRIEWNADAREGLRSALQAFFAGGFEQLAATFVEAQTRWIDERADSLRVWVGKQREQGRDPEELRTEIRRAGESQREQLEKRLERFRDGALAAMLSAQRPPASDREAEAREIAEAAARQAWEDASAGPLRAHFEAQFVEPYRD